MAGDAARAQFNNQAALIGQALDRGENPYGGAQNATNSLYNTYGRNSGLSYQEAAGIINNAYASRAPHGGGGDGSSGGGGGGGAAAPVVDQNAVNFLNSAIGRLGAQQDAGNSSIDNSYNSALQQLLQGKNVAQAASDKNIQQGKTDYVGAKNTIGANAGSTLNGLLRLLGQRGAGGSSAYVTAAPGAVARGATLQRADASGNFAHNQQALDQTWGQYLQGYNDQVNGAGTQRDNAKGKLNSDIANSRADLMQKLAGLPGQSASTVQSYLAQANAALDRAATYVPAAINVTTQAYQAPNLSSYTTNPQGAPVTNQGQAPGNDYFSPYLGSLLGKKQPGTTAAAAPVGG